MDLKKVQEYCSDRLDRKSAGRDAALSGSRTTIRYCANAIRAVHRSEWKEAKRLIREAEKTLREAEKALKPFPEIFYVGFLMDAQKEYVEARATYAIIRGEEVPSPEELNVGEAPYLNGLGETVGELRRFILDLMRHGSLERCEELLDAMDNIYYVLTSMDYPDAITGGLRRTTDVARGLIERTRGEFSISLIQENLESALKEHSKKLESG
ncbi:MAG TPA: haloacid dehalogenase [Actinomycetota bacterium]|jgi:translin|nr:haloacid dehalogenase [Actinomycetota bacterium]